MIYSSFSLARSLSPFTAEKFFSIHFSLLLLLLKNFWQTKQQQQKSNSAYDILANNYFHTQYIQLAFWPNQFIFIIITAVGVLHNRPNMIL